MCFIVFKLILIFCFLKLYKINSACSDIPIVNIESETGNGTTLEGTIEFDWNNGVYYAFRGIPYVQPPIDDLRFKDPQELNSLPEHIDARYDGHDCPSIYATNASENCLFLNVYTKNIKTTKPLPVLAFIHPGGLYLASALSTFIDAQYLLTKQLVLVTFNYRLGTLGFLNIGTKDVPGNAGFKDQVYALRWIQKYIKYFGGNTNDVALMGYSAGGLSVSLHLTSPMSKGLFHKAIIMSGVLPPQTILPQGEQIKLASRQAVNLNCTFNAKVADNVNDAVAQILNCLNELSGSEIAKTLRSMFLFGKDHPLYLWRPVIERDYGQARFLTQDFYELMKLGKFERVPLLIGFTDGEFCTAAAEILNSQELRHRFHAEFEYLASFVFMIENRENLNCISKTIKQHYNGLETTNNWHFDELCNAISDALIRFGAYRLSKLASKYVDVYNYKFVYRGDFSNLDYNVENPRVEHLDDLMYLFRMPQHEIKQTHNTNDAKIVDLYTNFIWNFITNGKISTNSLNFPKSFMLINETMIPQNGTNFDEATFWEELFP